MQRIRQYDIKRIGNRESAVIKTVGGEGALRQHFLDMGVIPGAEVTVIKFAPMGDPMELQIHGYELTLRLADADQLQLSRFLPVPESMKEPETLISRFIRDWAKKESIM